MSPNQAWSSVEEMQSNPAEALREGKQQVDNLVKKASDLFPSNGFLIASLASIAVSAGLQLAGKRQWSLFIGQWAPSFLIYGIFVKLTKKMGPD